MRRSVLLVLAMAAICLPLSTALAFHDEGVAYCAGCHTMHNTNGNNALIDPTGTGFPYLLKFANATDLCLSCHATSRGAVWAADPMNPGVERGPGNFAFLMEDNINDGRNGNQSANFIPGWRAGHTVISPSHGIVADALNPISPEVTTRRRHWAAPAATIPTATRIIVCSTALATMLKPATSTS